MQGDHQVRLSKDSPGEISSAAQGQAAGAAGVSSSPKQSVTQIVLSDGLPPAIGGAAAMAIIGAPLSAILAVGFLSAFGFTVLRSRSQQ